MSGTTSISYDSMIIFGLLLIYIIGGSYMEKLHCSFGHETGIAIIVGFAISGICYIVYPSVVEEFSISIKTSFFISAYHLLYLLLGSI